MANASLSKLLVEIRGCQVCADSLPLGPRPVVVANSKAKILLVGQAPGIRVHESGVPWDEPSGNRLRDWLGVSTEAFYDEKKFAIIPMGFCYPGTGATGDLPPRPECAPLWHERLLDLLPSIELTLVMGQYAQKSFLGNDRHRNLTETVKAWKEFGPGTLPLPHPSPRNNRWLKKNPWLDEELIPWLRKRVRQILEDR